MSPTPCIHIAYQIDWLLSFKYHCSSESLAFTTLIFGTIFFNVFGCFTVRKSYHLFIGKNGTV